MGAFPIVNRKSSIVISLVARAPSAPPGDGRTATLCYRHLEPFNRKSSIVN
jgi:hypothetical protein